MFRYWKGNGYLTINKIFHLPVFKNFKANKAFYSQNRLAIHNARFSAIISFTKSDSYAQNALENLVVFLPLGVSGKSTRVLRLLFVCLFVFVFIL